MLLSSVPEIQWQVSRNAVPLQNLKNEFDGNMFSIRTHLQQVWLECTWAPAACEDDWELGYKLLADRTETSAVPLQSLQRPCGQNQ